MDLPARVGRYEVEFLLGEGRHGRVLLARDPVLRRQVALKVLRDDMGLTAEQQGELADRVRQETRAAATLSHPAMVAVHDMGDDGHVGFYVVLELVHGPTLRDRLHEGPLPPEEVAQIARALSSALTHAHTAGLVHRAVTPENIMLAPTGVKLTEFGFCQGDPRTPAYSAPEVLEQSSMGALSDQFSLAATMYEAITGHRAFPGDDPAAVAAKVASGKVAGPRSLLAALRTFVRLDGVFLRALAHEPNQRFPSCDAFGAALAVELEGRRVTFLATPGILRSSVSRATRRWQNAAAIVAAAVIFGLIAIGRLQQPSAGGNASLRSVASAYAERPGGSVQRVAPPPASHPTLSSPSTTPPASATSSAFKDASPPTSPYPRIAPP
jgi:eukaryotic-like serine/threonine-protein kinase